ncbi:MAG: dTDP-4-dehydrorhamnose reductase [Microthrixaceae bacterium]
MGTASLAGQEPLSGVMRILYTGSRGQLGTELTARLDSTDHEHLGIDIDTVDLCDRAAVHDAVAAFSPELIVHGAAFTAVDRCEVEPDTAFAVNSLATRFVAEAARVVGAHVVYVSTDYVFDGIKESPYREWDTPSPRSVYGRSKLGGEHELDPCWTVARTSWVCSAHGNNMVKTVLGLLESHDTLSFVDDQIGHPTFAGDLAERLLVLGTQRAPGTFHITNDGPVSWYGFVRSIASAAGADPERIRPVSTADYLAGRPADAPPMAPRPANSVLDNFAWRGFGFGPPRHYTEPLAEVVAALRGR